MKKVYFLSTCSTCVRIMKQLPLDGFEKQDIKNSPITPQQLDAMKDLAGKYEALFSRRAMKYKSMDLGGKNLQESDYRSLILQEYTFLKRPVFVVDGKIFIGNSTKVVEELRKEII